MKVVNSRDIEKLVEKFLDNSFSEEDYFTDIEIQKKRFFLLSKLVADLFNCKNSVVCFQNISNLIILILYIYKEKFPIDIYSAEESNTTKNGRNSLKCILKENFF